MSLALLFPGQGVAHPEMLRWLDTHPLAQATLARMAADIGADWRARLADADWATGNGVAQCLLTGLSLAAWHTLAPQLPQPVVVAGYSVGELAACAAAEVFDTSDALWLARRRAQAMDASGAGAEGGLLSASGLSESVIASVCERLGLAVAIHIGPDRFVLGGPSAALAVAAPELTRLGAEAQALRVRVASHTPAMRAAAEAFAALIEPQPWRAARSTVVTNLDGEGQRQPQALKIALAGQIAATVQWHRCLQTVAERMPRCVLEVGPGTTLSRMWAARHADIPVRSVDEFHSADAVVAWVRKALG